MVWIIIIILVILGYIGQGMSLRCNLKIKNMALARKPNLSWRRKRAIWLGFLIGGFSLAIIGVIIVL